LLQIADESKVAVLSVVDIAFNARITSLQALHRIHNLVELSLIHCEALTVAGLESQAHSLEVLNLVGCGLSSMVFCRQLVNLRTANFGEN
jgi:hypothetical protein